MSLNFDNISLLQHMKTMSAQRQNCFKIVQSKFIICYAYYCDGVVFPRRVALHCVVRLVATVLGVPRFSFAVLSCRLACASAPPIALAAALFRCRCVLLVAWPSAVPLLCLRVCLCVDQWAATPAAPHWAAALHAELTVHWHVTCAAVLCCAVLCCSLAPTRSHSHTHTTLPTMSDASAASSSLSDAVQQMRVRDDADTAAAAPGGAPVIQSPAVAAAAADLIGECELDAPELNAHWASVLPALLQPVRPASQPTLFFTDAGAAPVAADEAAAEGAAPDAAAAAVPSLYDVFVSALPADMQRWWRGCRACDRFIQRYASLAVLRDDPIDGDAAAAAAETGAEGAEKEKDEKQRPLRLVPLLWAIDPAADSDAAGFAPALRAMRALFTPQTKITGVFVPVKTNQPAQPGGAAVQQQGCTIGVPISIAQPRPAAAAAGAAAAQGEPNVEVAAPRTFSHMSVTFPPFCCQASASNQHGTFFEMLSRALENNIRDIEKAHELLTKNQLDYADQHKVRCGPRAS